MSVSAEQDTVDESIDAGHDNLFARFFGPNAPTVKLEFGALSHPGKVRPNNEDHYGVVRRCRSRNVLLTNLPAGFLPQVEDVAHALVVADGIGGAAFGELASMFALRAGWDLTSKAFKWHFKMTDGEAEELMDQLRAYGQLMHQALLDRAQEDPRLAGMGTTITGALIVGSEAFLAHVGDSRAYLFRGGSLDPLTRDHTLAQQLVDSGAIPSIDAASRLMQNMLVNCLGGRNRAEIEVDVHRIQLADGDRLLLCTDGLTDMVNEDEIAKVLQQRTAPDDACRTLVELALDHGGRDNVTVVLADCSMRMRN